MKIPCDVNLNCCGIYLIRNLINNKVYIGQSVNISRRWSEHRRSGQPEKYHSKNEKDINTPIHMAMQKYGIKNFTIEILQTCQKEKLNELEKYWIKKFHSNDSHIGYNLTNGGQDKVGCKGELHSQAKLSQIEVNAIKKLLKNSNLTLGEISNQFYNISKSTLSMINTGKIWNDENEKYPLRQTSYGSKGEKNPRSKFTEQQVLEIRTLYSQGKTLKDIPQYYKNIASDSAITAIMYGKTYTHLPIWDKKKQQWI